MPRGSLLTDFERGQITELARAGKTSREIGRRLKRSHTVVLNFLGNQSGYGKNHVGGRPKALTEREKRQVLRLASNSTKSIKGIKTSAGVAASRWTVWRTIRRSGHIVRAKLQVGPKLTETHKNARVTWVENRIEDRTDWTSIVFSDEKKFNLDGPDGYSYYWYDLRKEPCEPFHSVARGGSVMVWACLGMGGLRWCYVETNLIA
jgi:transposase